MAAKVLEVSGNKVKIELEIELGQNMLENEEKIQECVNEAGNLATGEALRSLDTDGSPIIIGATKWTAKKEKVVKEYQTPYGAIAVERYVYQMSTGGATFCPLDREARIIISSTPKFAKMISHKYANQASPQVKEDLELNHSRKIARSFIQNISEAIGTIAQAKQEDWTYSTPKQEKQIKVVSVGLDGTGMILCNDGNRQAMCGTVSLYSIEETVLGERRLNREHTIYVAASPEYGKATFKQRLAREIENVKVLYPDATYVGVADGAADNWTFLEKHTSNQVVDFYHATQYLADVAPTAAHLKLDRQKWLDSACHKLKHQNNYAQDLIVEMKQFRAKTLSSHLLDKLDSSITYFENHSHQMPYSQHLTLSLPIGSGVTEAACKTLVKQRLCCSGMKWTELKASLVLSLRCLVRTQGRWNQFWHKINCFGFPVAA